MKITIRLILSLVLIVALAGSVFSLYQVNREKGRLTADLERRSFILADSLQVSLVPLIEANAGEKLRRLVNRFGNRERLKGITVFDINGTLLASSINLELPQSVPYAQVVDSVVENRTIGKFVNIGGERAYVSVTPIVKEDDQTVGALAIFNDTAYIDVRLKEIWKDNIIRFFTLSVLVALSTVLVVRWSITGPIAGLAQWVRELRVQKGKDIEPVMPLRGNVLAPIISEVANLAKTLSAARGKTEDNTKARFQQEPFWTKESLKNYMLNELKGKRLFLVSNREPYVHEKEGNSIRCMVPAGGLVTALDPVMRVCDGIWIAHGSGSADRETVNKQNKILVPPDNPAYTLRRIWITKEEENGYYYGFSNEGLWPLCHITHTRPIFRLEDWIYYQKVNQTFAEALLDEIAKEESPLVLIQDYHLALLPFLVKKKRPDAKVALFWHIPWPNPESFGICPWRQEILIGMLGADLLGFHIQFFCNNFLDTVDRFLESQIDWERFAVTRGGRLTSVKPFPIGIGFDGIQDDEDLEKGKTALRESILKKLGIQAQYLGIGVDRIDYTKGIPERFNAIERFLEKNPYFVEKLTFIELGAPSRSHIRPYRELIADIEESVEKINWRFQTPEWKPIVYLKAHHSHDEINEYYKASDFCMVTSLHDGMNLVAKEFIANHDNGGVLVLSQFTGASRELSEALIVNPYDIEEMADAIKSALTMEASEKTERMSRMKTIVRERNVYRWAGKLIGELIRVR